MEIKKAGISVGGKETLDEPPNPNDELMNEIDDIFEDINQLLIEPPDSGSSLKPSSSKDSLERQI